MFHFETKNIPKLFIEFSDFEYLFPYRLYSYNKMYVPETPLRVAQSHHSVMTPRPNVKFTLASCSKTNSNQLKI